MSAAPYGRIAGKREHHSINGCCAAPSERVARGKLKSPLEAKALPLFTQRKLPPPLFNGPVDIANGRIEVDFLWPEQRFALGGR